MTHNFSGMSYILQVKLIFASPLRRPVNMSLQCPRFWRLIVNYFNENNHIGYSVLRSSFIDDPNLEQFGKL